MVRRLFLKRQRLSPAMSRRKVIELLSEPLVWRPDDDVAGEVVERDVFFELAFVQKQNAGRDVDAGGDVEDDAAITQDGVIALELAHGHIELLKPSESQSQ